MIGDISMATNIYIITGYTDPQFNTLSFNQQSFSAASEINCCDVAIEICTGNSVIRMSNNIDPQLFGMVLSQLGGLK